MSIVSHQTLCAKYMTRSTREELRRRFVKAETTLFKVRFEEASHGDRSIFLEKQNHNWDKVNRLRNPEVAF